MTFFPYSLNFVSEFVPLNKHKKEKKKSQDQTTMKRLQYQDAHRLLQTKSVLLEKNASVQIITTQKPSTGLNKQQSTHIKSQHAS